MSRILGIDPGTNILGFAIIDSENKNLKLVHMGVIRLDYLDDAHQKLGMICTRVEEMISLYKPEVMAIEAPFFGKNVQSMLKLGRAQGVAIAVGFQKGLPTFEYSPKKIKQSVTGNGNASKEQVAAMLERILNTPMDHAYLDASDALSVAVCHYFQGNSKVTPGKKYSGWSSYAKANEEKITTKVKAIK